MQKCTSHRLASLTSPRWTLAGAAISLVAGLASGPDLTSGLGILLGRSTPRAERERDVPDLEVIEELSRRHLVEGHVVLLVGNLSDDQYTVPIRRLPAGIDQAVARGAVHDEKRPVDYVVCDVVTTLPTQLAAFSDLTPLAVFGADGRYRLLGLRPPAVSRKPPGTPSGKQPPR